MSNYNRQSPYDEFNFTNHVGVVFGSKSYVPLACGIDKLKLTSEGTQPEIGLTVADKDATITKLIQEFKHIEGAKLRVVITKKRYLDGQPLGVGQLSDRIITELNMRIARRQSHKPSDGIVFVLGNPIDVEGVFLPRRLALRKCVWDYRGPQCGYTGTRYFTNQGTPTLDPNADKCGREISDCDARANTARYGGFPSLQRR